jgi:hypothetical protein
MDSLALTQYGSPFSLTDIWRDNYNQDSVVSTEYALKSPQENFAEVGVIGVYDKVVPGGIGNIQPNWSQMFHQYATYQGYLGDNILPGGTCRNRLPNSEPVPMGNSAKRALGIKPDVGFKNSTIDIIDDSHLDGSIFITPAY